MKETGLESKTVHCLRVTTVTNLFRAGHQEKLIRERTGHVSSALFTYEKPRNDRTIAVSKRVGQSVSKVVSLVDNCLNPPRCLRKTKSLIFQTRNLISFLVKWTGLKLVKEVQQRIIAEQFALSNSTFTQFAGNK